MQFKTRQFNPQPPTGQGSAKIYPFILGIISEVEIKQAFDPRVFHFHPTSLLDEGDRIIGQSIDGVSSMRIDPEIGKGSGEHSASFGKIHQGYARIRTPMREFLNRR